MRRHHSQFELLNRVAGGILGAITGAIWAFLRTWIASANSFNQLGRGLVIVGILLGWIPGMLAACAGLVYGAVKGESQGFDGIMAVLMGIEIFIRNFEESSLQVSHERARALSKIELLPQDARHKRRSHHRFTRV